MRNQALSLLRWDVVRMRIRVTGTITQVDVFIDRLRRSNLVIITSVSKWFPWTRHDPNSKLGSRYVDFELDVEPLTITAIDEEYLRLPEEEI